MRIPIPKLVDTILDAVACALFPRPRPILGNVTALDLALAGYLLALAAGLAWWFDDWRWLLVTLLCGALCWIYDRVVLR